MSKVQSNKNYPTQVLPAMNLERKYLNHFIYIQKYPSLHLHGSVHAGE